jgi:DNA-binding LytR/AlgR family response regulator
MGPLRVLIVEDEFILSMEIEQIVEETVPSVVVIKSSVTETKKVIDKPFDLALLDIDVTNGKTYEIARLLDDRQVHYIFVSGSDRGSLPEELRSAPFISKPFVESQIRDAVVAADNRRKHMNA